MEQNAPKKIPEKPAPQPKRERRTIVEILRELYEASQAWFNELFNLDDGADQYGTIISIKNNHRMRGANAWLLICSIMIASLGLDLDSPAVIIGAMLISPLMSPILGVGLSVAINDRETLYISLQHFGVSIIIALVTSTFYFWITPLGQLTDEIQARTAPTLLDGLVAVFGGLAGIISVTRKDKSNAIPGVAIATALMPPLCVTGYGIAKGNFPVAINSFYLFFLNSFFIALTTYIIIRLLRFPFKAYVNEREARRTRLIIGIFSILLIIPSAQILFRLLGEQREVARAEAFIVEYFENNPDTKCIDYSIIHRDTSSQLILQLLGKTIPDDSLYIYYAGMEKNGLEGYTLNLIQDADLELEQIDKMQLELSNLGNLASEFQSVSKAKTEQDIMLEQMQIQLDSIVGDTIPFTAICEEIKVLFPNLSKIGFAKIQQTDFKDPYDGLPIFLVEWDRKQTRRQRNVDEGKIYDFIKMRANLDTLEIISY